MSRARFFLYRRPKIEFKPRLSLNINMETIYADAIEKTNLLLQMKKLSTIHCDRYHQRTLMKLNQRWRQLKQQHPSQKVREKLDRMCQRCLQQLEAQYVRARKQIKGHCYSLLIQIIMGIKTKIDALLVAERRLPFKKRRCYCQY